MHRGESQGTGKAVAERLLALENLALRLGYDFYDLGLLDRALRHSSYAHENPDLGPSNEQLEFLGDAVLALTVSDLLLSASPDSSEGELSRRRAALVNARQLAALAKSMDLGNFLLLGRGEEQQGGRRKPSLLADALEAVLAAVFLDGGLAAARDLTRRWFGPLLHREGDLAWQDAKTALQELTQERFKASPVYLLLEESGPGHEKHFQVEVHLGERTLSQGGGPTKKQAEQEAARLALAVLRQEEPEGGKGG
ncbi:MAG: ribonuclease III [Deltaproteobacteria bacterium]|nr:ribonuclease III [Deltaproteobacteria bacterium]